MRGGVFFLRMRHIFSDLSYDIRTGTIVKSRHGILSYMSSFDRSVILKRNVNSGDHSMRQPRLDSYYARSQHFPLFYSRRNALKRLDFVSSPTSRIRCWHVPRLQLYYTLSHIGSSAISVAVAILKGTKPPCPHYVRINSAKRGSAAIFSSGLVCSS